MRKLLLTLIALLATPVAAGESYERSWAPIFGYDPTVGTMVGAALFVYPEDGRSTGRHFDAMAAWVERPAGMINFNYRERKTPESAELSVRAGYSNIYETYFGEGSDTPIEPLARIDQSRWHLRPELALPISTTTQWTLFIDHRGRRERGTFEDPHARLFPDYSATAYGTGVRYDTRNTLWSTSAGQFAELRLLHLPSDFTTERNAHAVTQAEMELRSFHAITDEIVFAARGATGYSWGTPGHLFRYLLGGSIALRGLEANRVRGDRYWLVQNELRLPVWRFISCHLLLESGGIGDGGYSRPLWTGGAGVDFGLPPSGKVKLRVEMARAEGEHSNMYVNFGYAF